MSASDSYEIHFSEQGRWSLAEVLYDREAAVTRAKALAGEPPTVAVRVMWSRFEPATDTFSERTLFSIAATSDEPPPEADDDGLGCTAASDLYRPETRMVVHGVLAGDLERRRLTVIELLHDFGHVRALSDSGNTIQGAVQRHVIETSRPGAPTVQARIRRLYAIIDQATLEVHRWAKAAERPVLAAGGLSQIVESWLGQPDGERMIYSALAEFLRPAKEWTEKLTLMAQALGPQSKTPALRFIDEIATEIIAIRGGLASIIGAAQSGTQAVMALIAAVDGTGGEATLTSEAATLIATSGGIDRLPAFRGALARRARRIVEATPPLGDNSVPDEIKQIELIWRAVQRTLPDSPLRRLLPALERRALRQTSAERLGVLLAKTPEAWRRVDQLIGLEQSLVGAEAKEALGKYLLTVLADRSAPAGLDERPDANPGEMLRRLRRWQRQLAASSLAPTAREELGRLVDRHAVKVLAERKLFEAVARRHPTPWEQALALMDLVQAEHFTQGDATRMAQERMLGCLKQANGLAALKLAMRDNDAIAVRGRALYDYLAQSRAAAAAQ